MRLVGRWKEIGHPGGRHLYAMKGAFAQESEGERDAFAALFADDPYPPDCQVVLLERLRVDFAYLYAGLFMEYLGEPHNARSMPTRHARSPSSARATAAWASRSPCSGTPISSASTSTDCASSASSSSARAAWYSRPSPPHRRGSSRCARLTPGG